MLAGAAACASKLVDVSELEEVPKEFSQKISNLNTDVVDATQTVAPSGVELSLPPSSSNVSGAPVSANHTAAPLKKNAGAKLAAKPVAKTSSKTGKGKKEPGWTPQAWPYGIGEVAEYSLRYGLIEGGVVTMKVMEPQIVDGKQALLYEGHVKSTKLLELFYKVDDVIKSWVTLSSHLPLRQEINQRESAQWGNRVVTFDTAKQTAKFYATTEKKDKKKKVERFESDIANFAQDIFGALYFWRFIEPKDVVNFGVHDRGKDWSNETIYLGTEVLDLPVGKTRARRYKMNPRIQGHLEPKGDVEAWFADDDTRIMVRFRANIKFGSVTGDLRKFQPGQKITLPPPQMRTPTDLNNLGSQK